VNHADHLLAREDADVAEVLEQRMAREGVTTWNRSAVTGAIRSGMRRRVAVRTPDGERHLDVDAILIAAGRRPRVRGLGLERLGVAMDDRGIAVTPTGRTSVRSIWAVGDVTDTFRFTHWGGHQARLVVRNALFPGATRDDATPAGAPSPEPEVASVFGDRGPRDGVASIMYQVPFEASTAPSAMGRSRVRQSPTRRAAARSGRAIVHLHAGG
jgi:dihydrolipoamide dehydrogenase